MKIYLDFEGQHKYFSNPIKVFKTNDFKLIKQQLDEIETFTKQGYYAVGYLAYESAMGLNKSKQTENIDYCVRHCYCYYLVFFKIIWTLNHH